jgi:hypothetical protein
MRAPSRLTTWLAAAPPWAFAAYAGTVAFATYFCMYAFRKPFAAASFEGDRLLGVEPKTAFVIAQIIGYTLSKYIGVKVCSEIAPERRGRALVLLVAIAETALLAFAVLPPGGRIVAMVLNGLPLGMVWGLVVGSLEGRKTSELLLAMLSCSFIVSSGVVKDVGRFLMRDCFVSESWMPFVTGLLFFPLFIASVALLGQIPRQSAEDAAERTERVPMMAKERLAFAKELAPGLAMLFVVYFFLTAFRDFRDNYGVEIFKELGYGAAPAIFTRTEIPVAVGVMAAMAALSLVRDNKRGLLGTFGIMIFGAALLAGSTVLFDEGSISGAAWMLATGLGSYLVYVPFNSVLFDRMIAHTRIQGTAVFAIYLADSLGYTGSIGVQIFRDLGGGSGTRLSFFRGLTYFTAAVALVLLAFGAAYFVRWRPRLDSGAAAAEKPR